MYTIEDLRSALAGAPNSGGPSNPELIGWTDGKIEVCNDCTGRISGRGCGYMLRGLWPIWRDEIASPITCALADCHIAAPE